jgi:formate hydrogenlyase transcriptional activator
LQPARAHPEIAAGKLRTLEAVEREQRIKRTLETTAWQISGVKGAAAILGMNPNTLRSRMLKLGISRVGWCIE